MNIAWLISSESIHRSLATLGPDADHDSKPVHGLIFLYQYSEGEEPTAGRQDCPDHLWFANQVRSTMFPCLFSCANRLLRPLLMHVAPSP